MGVCRLLVVCLGWFRFLRFHVFVSTERAVCISIREQRRPDRSCGEVRLIEETKKADTQNRKLHVVLCVGGICVGSVPLPASVDRVSDIVRSLQ